MNIFTAGVAVAEGYKNDELVLVSKTLINSSIEINVQSSDVAGGKGNMKFGKYFHTSEMNAELEDIMFRMEYFAQNVGSPIEFGGDIFLTETHVSANKILTTKYNISEWGTAGRIAWITKAGEDDWTKVTATSVNTITVTNDGTYCVKYMTYNPNSQKLTITANMIPDTIKLVLTADLYAGDIKKIDSPTTTKVGKIQITIPRFNLNGSQSLSLTSTGSATTRMSGTALATFIEGCEDDAVYAVITQTLDGDTWQENVKMLAIEDDDISVQATKTTTLSVYAVGKDNRAWKPSPSDLTFLSTNTAKATVNANGVITGVSTGTATIKVSITANTAIETYCNVTVTA